MDIYVQSTIGECGHYIFEGKTERVSTIVSPLRIEGPESRLKIASGCSMFLDCEDRRCYFSAAGRSRDKIKARGKDENKS